MIFNTEVLIPVSNKKVVLIIFKLAIMMFIDVERNREHRGLLILHKCKINNM